MRPTLLRSMGPMVVASILVVGCGDADVSESMEATERVVDASPDTIVSTRSGLLAAVSDMVVDAEGRLFVADQTAHTVHVFKADGLHERAMGREGSGPGEFNLPTGLRIEDDAVIVVDAGNGRNQTFSVSGQYTSTQPWPGTYAPTLGPGGMLAQPTFGIDSSLAVIRDPAGEETAPIGAPLAEVEMVVDRLAMREQILNGEIPSILMNSVKLIIDEARTVWLLVPATGRVERYRADGAQLWSVDLDEPEFVPARIDFVERNRAASPRLMTPLEYFRDAQVVSEDLWILLASSEDVGVTIAVMSPDGSVRERIRFPKLHGATAFAVDQSREVAYFFLGDSAALVRSSLR